MTAAFRRGTFGTGVVRGNGLALQQSGVVSLGTVAIPGDTNFASNILLAKTTSVNASTNNTFLDGSGNAFTITRNGTPTQGSVTPYWPSGYWSGYFDDLSSNNLTISSPATNFQFAGDFTIEAWYWASSGGDSSVFVEFSGNYLAFNINPTGNTFNIYLNSGSPTFSPAATIPLSQWNHVALVRSGSGSGNIKVYLNGTALGTTGTNTSTLGYSSPSYARIGGGNATSSVYISNLRIVNGTAVYTSNFTPPTTPLTAITNTVLLTCQDNRFKDNSTNALAVTASGTPKIQSFQPFNPPAVYSTSTHGGSGYFDGSSSYLSLANNAALQFGSGNFTIEAWIYLTATKENTIVARFPFDNANNEWGFQILSGGTLSFYYSTSGTNTQTFISGGVPTLNVWNHVAAVRSSSTITLYINGVSVATGSIGGSIYSGTTTTTIGTYAQSSYPSGYGVLGGYISNLRIVKGTAVYTAAFTPPTAPVTAIANTSLLVNFTNAGIYDTTIQSDATTVGSAQVSTTQFKWSPTSMKFNGTSDYLTTPSNPALALRTGDFTIEFWMYPTAAQTGDIVDTRVSGDSANSWCVQLDSTNINFTGPGSNYLSYPYTLNTWTHVAYTRVSGSVSVYINGTKYGSSVTLTNDFTGTVYKIGATFNNFYYAGYIQDLRVTRGLARYTANFTAPTTTFSNSTASTYTPAVPDAPIIANITTITNTSVKIGYMAPLLNGGSTITSYTAVSTPGGITATSVTSRSGTITVGGLMYSNTYTFAVYATNAIGTSTYSAASKSITTPAAQLGKIFILSDMDLALTDLVLLNTTIASGLSKAKTYALATIYGSD
jgi:hypothetical protein